MVIVADQVSHESPDFVDIVPGGLPEIACSETEPSATIKREGIQRTLAMGRRFRSRGSGSALGHGLGLGDLDADGDLDILDRYSWWENPGTGKSGLWKRVWVPEQYERGGYQIHVHDVDGDGLQDIVTSLNGHGF